MAHKVEVTAESIPPETPTTQPSIPDVVKYFWSHATMWAATASGAKEECAMERVVRCKLQHTIEMKVHHGQKTTPNVNAMKLS